MIARSDPLEALVAERFRIEADCEALEGVTDCEFGAATEEAARRIGHLDEVIADIVATSTAGIAGQARVLYEIGVGVYADNDHRSADCADRLIAAIAAAYERLSDGARL